MNAPYKQGHYFYLLHEDINGDLSFPTQQEKETADKVLLSVCRIFKNSNSKVQL